MKLEAVVPGKIWHAQQPLRFGPLAIRTRMTVVRLRDGRLWIHSPIAPSPHIDRSLRDLGDVRYVVAPNRSHHLFLKAFLQAHPEASVWLVPGLHGKDQDLAELPELQGRPPWDDELVPYSIGGLPIIGETVWFHDETGTLILTDLLFCFGRDNPWPVRATAGVLGVLDKLGMSRTMKLAVRDREALAASVRPLLALPVERIVLAHDQIITDQARSRLEQAFRWLW